MLSKDLKKKSLINDIFLITILNFAFHLIEIYDNFSAAYQRIAWEALKKSIHGLTNKINVDNIGKVTRDLLRENIVRGRGLLCRSIMQAQLASTTYTHVYAALVAIINTKVI